MIHQHCRFPAHVDWAAEPTLAAAAMLAWRSFLSLSAAGAPELVGRSSKIDG